VTAAQRTTYRRGAPPRAVEAVDLAAVAAWRRGVIRIGDVPLDAAIAELDRYRPGRIVLLGGGDYQSVSGAFDLGRIDAAVAGLAATHGLTVTAITDYLLILR
jgi:transmembrane sensor